MVAKRKIPSLGLERRVRPRREEEYDVEPEESEVSSGDDEVSEEGNGRDEDDEDEESDGESGSGSGSESDADEPAAPKVNLSAVSFGALARAQASLPPSERKSKTSKAKAAPEEEAAPKEAKVWKKKTREELKRSSKHAPQEQSSKRAVSRFREIIADPRRKARDPRFDPAVGKTDEEKANKAYAFLDDYRDSEMADLRIQIKKTKDYATKESLKRELMSMESRRKARKRKEDEDNLVKEHRQKEKELVAQGKTPFYLKKSEQKKKLLMDRYAGMSKGQVDRAIERKRKKVAGQEKKEMGFLEGRRPRE